MAWITFDPETQSALNRVPGGPGRTKLCSGEALDYALSAQKNSVVLLPSGDDVVLLTIKKALISRVIPPKTEPAPETGKSSFGYIGGGFLGLTDEVLIEEEPKKRGTWWKRLFD
jgi:hypothetical protein